MQIIYSAGTTSPTSPRASPKPSPRHPKSPRSPCHLNYNEGWRPVMPGYKAPAVHHQSVVIQRTVEVQHLSDASDNNLKDSIPDMPRALAITCLVCNILLPGLGTFVSGLSVLCCSQPRPRTRDKSSVLLVNSWVALLQFLTTFLCLLGWIWSIMWGVSFLSISGKPTATESDETQGEDDSPPEESAAAARAANAGRGDRMTHSRTTTTTTVSIPAASTADSAGAAESTAPIIILQEPPVIVDVDSGGNGAGSNNTASGSGTAQGTGGGNAQRAGRTLNPYNPRHQRILRQQNEELPSILLTPDALEQLVFHNAPLPDGMQDSTTDDLLTGPKG